MQPGQDLAQVIRGVFGLDFPRPNFDEAESVGGSGFPLLFPTFHQSGDANPPTLALGYSTPRA